MENSFNNQNQFLDSEEIDLSKFVNILISKKIFISCVSIIFLFFGYLYYKSKQPIWQGQFDIVLRNNSSSQSNLNPLSAMNSSILGQFGGIGPSNLDLKTEVKILESPSVLLPVYDYVRELNKIKNINVSSWTFQTWKRKLNVKLEMGTSVLNINYKDSNKNQIKPVSKMISSEYQKYSGKDRDKGLQKGIKYLEMQKIKLTEETKNSIQKFQKFSFENNLGNYDLLLDSDNNSSEEYLIYRLNELEASLLQKSLLYTPTDPVIIDLKQEIASIKDNLSVSPEILFNFKDLQKIALRNEKMLIEVEKQLESLKLDLARQEDPWELISKPTVMTNPVSPNRDKSLIYSFFMGLGLSSLYVLIKNRKELSFYNLIDLKKIIPYAFLKSFPIKNKEIWGNSVNFIKEIFSLETTKNKVGFFFID